MFDLTPEQVADKDYFTKNFRNSWYYNKLISVNLEKYREDMDGLVAYVDRPRDNMGFFYDPEIFYYLKYIFEKNPSEIYDIGCGNNFFKYVLGDVYNIIGVDDMPGTDKDVILMDFQQFFKQNKRKIKAAFSVNCLHGDCPVFAFKSRIKEFVSIFDKDGIGFATFGVNKMIKQTPPSIIKKLFNLESELEIGQHNFVEVAIPYVESQLTRCIDELKNNVRFDIVEVSKLHYRDRFNGTIKIAFTVTDPI